MARPRVLLADDHRIFSEGLKHILEPQFEIVGIVADGRDLIAAAARLRPDVVVADISMPSLNGIDASRQLRRMSRAPGIVFLTMHEDATFARSAFRAGASGYVLKRSAPAEIMTAIQEAAQGRLYISRLLGGELRNILIKAREKPERLKADLTARQRQILQLFAEGKVPKEIAGILSISARTVEFHKYRLFQATGARTFADLTRYAIAHGIVQAS